MTKPTTIEDGFQEMLTGAIGRLPNSQVNVLRLFFYAGSQHAVRVVLAVGAAAPLNAISVANHALRQLCALNDEALAFAQRQSTEEQP